MHSHIFVHTIILRANRCLTFLVMDVFLHRSNKLRWQDRGILLQSKWILLHLI